MNTRNQKRKKKIIEKNKPSQAQEIQDIEEIKEVKIPKKKKNEENKEKKENSSSDAISPNKKGQKRKKNNNKLVEVDNSEVDSILIKRNVSPPAPIPSKENKQKRNGKKSLNNVAKINNHKVKKSKDKDKININLDENYEDNNNSNDKNLNKEDKSMSIDNKNKKGNKSPSARNRKVKRERKNRKIGKNIKEKNDEEKRKEIIQYFLSSSEDNEKEKENNPNKPNNNRKRTKTESTNKTLNKDKNGYSSTIIAGEKRKKKVNNKIGSNSSSKILDINPLKENINKFLGKKRKPENITQQSISPIKKQNKSEMKKGKTIPQIKNQKGGLKTLTKSLFKDEIKNNLLIPKMIKDNQDSKKKYVIPELAVLEQLFIEYGYDKVLDSLYKPNLGHNKLDSCLQGLKKSCSIDKLPIILFKIFFSYFETKIGEIKNDYKRSTSAKNLLSRQILNKNVKKSPQNQDKKSNNSIKDKSNNVDSTKKNEEKVEISGEKSDKVSKKSKSDNQKNTIKEEKKVEKKKTSIGSHYHKDKEGNIYKYQICNLDRKGYAIFKCYDDKCYGMGIYDLDTMRFAVTNMHNLKYEEHDYISDDDNVFKDLDKENKNNAQVFKENEEKVVKYY